MLLELGSTPRMKDIDTVYCTLYTHHHRITCTIIRSIGRLGIQSHLKESCTRRHYFVCEQTWWLNSHLFFYITTLFCDIKKTLEVIFGVIIIVALNCVTGNIPVCTGTSYIAIECRWLQLLRRERRKKSHLDSTPKIYTTVHTQII
jgi:hypothetical protein